MPPDDQFELTPGLYFVDQDVSQGGVKIGVRSLRRGDDHVAAATVMNYILGGGGFSSRITQTVRSDEGLAYSAGSSFSPGVYSDGVWMAGYESKSKTVALAAALVFNEIENIKKNLISDADLELAKGALIEQFPSVFQSRADIISVFVGDEITGREPNYWSTYKSKINDVTKEDVRLVANRLLDPNKMVMLIVGDWDEIAPGNDRASIQDITEVIGGPIVELPLRDPLTLEPIQ